MNHHPTDCENKALQINLDPTIYGTIAEIGAGQEIARQLFRVGAASGTVAKTMSAYDMQFSDDIYGPVKRYVSRERLLGMLDHEYALLIERLDHSRGERTRFFAFADTVAARNFKGTNESHGWMGVRFQAAPREPCNEIILHVRMLDSSNSLQADALGLFGVNVLYGAFNYSNQPENFIRSLADGIGTERIEVEAVEFNGPLFKDIDQRSLNLALLEQDLTPAVMFGLQGRAELASEVLYKRPVLLLRGSFRPITKTNIDMIESGLKQFLEEAPLEGREPLVVLEMTVRNLLANKIDSRQSFLDIADTIAALGYQVLVTNYQQYFRLSHYLRRYTQMPVAVIIGANNLYHIFDEKFYEDLSGGILEAFGRLFRHRVKMYVYPMPSGKFEQYFATKNLDGTELHVNQVEFVTAENLLVPEKQRALFKYLLETELIRNMKYFDKETMSIHSKDVRAQIERQDPKWRDAVPKPAADLIETQGLFRIK